MKINAVILDQQARAAILDRQTSRPINNPCPEYIIITNIVNPQLLLNRKTMALAIFKITEKSGPDPTWLWQTGSISGDRTFQSKTDRFHYSILRLGRA